MKTTRHLASTIAALAWAGSSVAYADPLFDAVKAGDTAALQAALSAGADVNQPDLSGTALHVAAGIGNVEVVEALVAAGADLEAIGEPAGAHPLHVAAQVNEPAVAALLIGHGAQVDARDGEGRTPLMVASGLGNVEVAVTLLDAGADPLAEDSIYHDVPIAFATWNDWPEAMKLLLSSGADVDVVNPETGVTLLHYAAESNSPRSIEFLIANGADAESRDKAGRTPLQAAGSPATAELLRKLGVTE